MGLGWEHEKASNMSTNQSVLVPGIESRIQEIRDLLVMIDVDLVTPYGVQSKRLDEQVKRNGTDSPATSYFSSRLMKKPRWSQIATTSKTCNFPRHSNTLYS